MFLVLMCNLWCTTWFRLGPLLLLIYVNDIGNVLPNKTVKLFADDTNIFIFHQDISMINIMANEYMFSLSQWFIANKLSLNIDKRCFITLANHKVQNPVILINDFKISNVDYLWSPYVIGRPYIFSSCSFFLLLFFPRLISAVGDWMSTILLHMAWP